MASVRFYLYDAKAQTTNIYFRLSYGAFEIVNGKKKYLPLQYYINESIEPFFWNAKQGRAKGDRRFPQYPEFNSRLDDIENTVLSILRRLQNDNTSLSDELLRLEFDKVFKDTDQTETMEAKQIELMEFISNFIENCNRSEGTKKSYRRVEKDLQEYQRKNNVMLTFEKIDVDFHTSFVAFLQSKKYAPNTIGTRVKVVKSFMNEAYERNLHKNLDFKKKMFSKPSEETKAIYLNTNELTILYKLDLSKDKYLNNVRDWFLIGAYTGLRFSDLERLTKENFKDNTIEIRTQKTDKTVTLPLHPIVLEILEKYEYELPKIISNQKFNEYIKSVAKLAEIEESILVEEIKGKLKCKRLEKKYNLISAHTARRSFATNAFLAGVSPIQIMKLTGHKSESSFLKYIKVSDEENAKILQMHPFFRMAVK